ncbi:MAG: hypothetical protein JSU72_03895 [Deltaproteobacteria bacterium]|nr:MAG: hypothetical protein JSU72_03895 [Deltaproteobacteria bacterium]
MSFHRRPRQNVTMLKYWLVSSVALWMIPFCLLHACSGRNDEEVIRQLIKEGTELAEEHNIGGLMKLTTEDFVADPGQHDHRGVRAILFRTFAYYGQFKIVYPRPSVDLVTDGKTAAATLYFLIVKKHLAFPELEALYHDPRGWLESVGENADLYRLHLELRRNQGDWLVRLARLESFTGVGFSERL